MGTRALAGTTTKLLSTANVISGIQEFSVTPKRQVCYRMNFTATAIDIIFRIQCHRLIKFLKTCLVNVHF